MRRYFFDIATPSGVQYDFSGSELTSVESARHVAELIALDIACAEADYCASDEVRVHDAERRLFSIVVQQDAVLAS
ncbi:MAG: DUF6894 family protein [Xanthobacteraceae bacterium]